MGAARLYGCERPVVVEDVKTSRLSRRGTMALQQLETGEPEHYVTKKTKVIIPLIAMALSAGGTKQVKAQDTAQEVHNKALVRRSFDAWTSGSGSPFDLLAEDVSWTITGN